MSQYYAMRTIGAEYTTSNIAYVGGVSTYCNVAPSSGGVIVSGSIGIGVSNPSFALQVANPSLFQSNVTIQGSLTHEVSGQKFYSSSTGYVLEKNEDPISITLRQSSSNSPGYVSLSASNGLLDITTYDSVSSNASHTYVTSTGSLGIGIQQPTEKLHIDGSVKVTSNVYALSRLGVGVSNSPYTAHIQGSLFAQTYCNLFVDSYENASTSNAPTASALKATYDKVVAFSNSIAVNSTILFSSNTAAAAYTKAEWSCNNALMKQTGGTIQSSVIINSNLDVLSNVNVYSRLFASNILVAGDVMPFANEAYDLGSESNRFRDIYLSGNTIDLGGVKIRKNFGKGGLTFLDTTNNTAPTVASIVTLSNNGQISLFTSNNALGVNNSNPTATLDVVGDASISGNLRLQGNLATNKPLATSGVFVLKNSNVPTGRTTISAAVQNLVIGPTGMSLYITSNTSNDAFRFVTGADFKEIATITGQGNVGVSASNPTHRITISPSAYEAKVSLYNKDASSFYGMGVSSNQFNLHIPDSNAAFSLAYSGSNGNGKELLRVNGNGSFIFCNPDSNNLTIDLVRGMGGAGADRNADWRIQNTSNGHLVYTRLTSNEFVNAEVLRINQLGYIGVSNVNPRASLDIQGTLSTNNTYVRKDFTYQSGASNTWTQKLYLGEFATGSTTRMHITSLGDYGTSPYTFEVQKPTGSNIAPHITMSTNMDVHGSSRARMYWSRGSTNADTYFHMWFDWYDIGIADSIYVTLDVFGATASTLPWLPTAEPVLSSTQISPPILNITDCNALGVSYSNPQCSLHVGGKTAFNNTWGYYVPRSVVESMSPNVWGVAGESATRLGNYTITQGGTIISEIINGKYGWKLGAQNSYIEIPYTISSTTTTWTVALAIASPPVVISTNGIFFSQIVSDTDALQNANHYIAIDPDFRTISVDEYQPSGGGYYFSNVLPPCGLAPQSVLILRRNTTSSMSMWYNGIKLGETATYTEVYSGANPTKMRFGSRSLNVANRTPVGMAIAAFAVWDAAITDAHITSLTYDALTCL